MKKLRDDIKTAVFLNPVARPKKMFEEHVDKIPDTLGKNTFSPNILYFELLDGAARTEFDALCPPYYSFLPSMQYWKRSVIPR